MGRERVVIERLFCDACGAELKQSAIRTIAINGERWEVELCNKDLKRLQATFAEWTKNARRLQPRRRTASQTKDEWDYLESRGFTRHRGRKSAAEAAALAER